MAAAEVAGRPQSRRRPFANLVKRLANFKGGEDKKEKEEKASNKKANGTVRGKKNSAGKNNPYPESGHLPQESHTASDTSHVLHDTTWYSSMADRNSNDREGPSQSNKSGAPTLATNAETVHSDAGHSKAATTTTGAAALSSMDGAGAGSTFSSPNHSQGSLATTLTTIQSSNMPNPTNGPSSHTLQSQPMGSSFSHQYPVTPGQLATGTALAIPRHLHGGDVNPANSPATYNSATAGNLLTDNASILTLASSSKRRRRSMDTDASVRAMAPSSVFGGSRESLPLSVLSISNANNERYFTSGMHTASAERASIYSSSGMMRDREAGGVSSPALASERNSYYANKQPGDAKSLRSISNLQRNDDARSIGGIDSRSLYDARSTHDVASLRSVDARSQLATADHGRNGSINDSISGPIASRQQE